MGSTTGAMGQKSEPVAQLTVLNRQCKAIRGTSFPVHIPALRDTNLDESRETKMGQSKKNQFKCKFGFLPAPKFNSNDWLEKDLNLQSSKLPLALNFAELNSPCGVD